MRIKTKILGLALTAVTALGGCTISPGYDGYYHNTTRYYYATPVYSGHDHYRDSSRYYHDDGAYHHGAGTRPVQRPSPPTRVDIHFDRDAHRPADRSYRDRYEPKSRPDTLHHRGETDHRDRNPWDNSQGKRTDHQRPGSGRQDLSRGQSKPPAHEPTRAARPTVVVERANVERRNTERGNKDRLTGRSEDRVQDDKKKKRPRIFQ